MSAKRTTTFRLQHANGSSLRSAPEAQKGGTVIGARTLGVAGTAAGVLLRIPPTDQLQDGPFSVEVLC